MFLWVCLTREWPNTKSIICFRQHTLWKEEFDFRWLNIKAVLCFKKIWRWLTEYVQVYTFRKNTQNHRQICLKTKSQPLPWLLQVPSEQYYQDLTCFVICDATSIYATAISQEPNDTTDALFIIHKHVQLPLLTQLIHRETPSPRCLNLN